MEALGAYPYVNLIESLKESQQQTLSIITDPGRSRCYAYLQ